MKNIRHTIAVANVFVEELAVLCDGLHALLPYEYQIRYRNWKAEMDRLTAGQ